MKTLALIILFTFSAQIYAESLPDMMADGLAHMALKRKVNQYYQLAIACTPLEVDNKSGLNVTDWQQVEPVAPHWKMLKKFNATAIEARDYALAKHASDKVLHCLAGCFVATKLDYISGVYLGWFKELLDASDCKVNTHFEKADYEATQAGAIIGSAKNSCESFCLRDDIKNLDGDQMLEAAQRE